MKQIRLKDRIDIIEICPLCPYQRDGYPTCAAGCWMLVSDIEFPRSCPLEEYILDEKTKNFLDDIENLTGGPSIKITPKQYNEVKE